MVYLYESVATMSCDNKDKHAIPPIKIENKMDINLKKLSITGWWYLYTNTVGYKTVLAIAENEVS